MIASRSTALVPAGVYAASVTSAILRSLSASSLLMTGWPSCISVVFAPVAGSTSVIVEPVSLPMPIATIFTPASRAAFAVSSGDRAAAAGEGPQPFRPGARREAAPRALDPLADARAAAARAARVDGREHR